MVILPTEKAHWQDIWNIIGTYPDFMSGFDSPEVFFTNHVKDSLTFINGLEIVGCAYIEHFNDRYCNICLVTKRRSIHLNETPILLKQALQYFFSKYPSLEMIGANIRKENRACRRLGALLGGIQTHVFKDSMYGSIMREAVI